jgi:lipoprotein-anchoring transpeptidase ErfK/SrfK
MRWVRYGAAGLVGVVAAAGVALVAYDRSQADVVARGVSVAGFGVGGLTRAEAEARLRARLLPRATAPVVVEAEAARLALAARAAGVRPDVRALAAAAVERGRRGGFFARVTRSLLDREVVADVRLPARVSSRVVAAFAARVAETVDRAPLRGRVSVAGDALGVVPGVRGVTVDRGELARRVTAALTRPLAPRLVHAPLARPEPEPARGEAEAAVEALAARLHRLPRNARVAAAPGGLRVVPGRDGIEIDRARLLELALRALRAPGTTTLAPPARAIEPRVRTRELPERYPVFLTVSKSERKLRLYRKLRLVRTYVVAVGSPSWPTPTGLFRIVNKAVNPAWSVPRSSWAGALAGRLIPGGAPDNPLKARWLGFYGGAGIHGTADVGSLGGAASHGCIRMSVPDVVELYEHVPVRAPIYIA